MWLKAACPVSRAPDTQHAALFIAAQTEVELDTHSNAVMRIVTLERVARIADPARATRSRHLNNK